MEKIDLNNIDKDKLNYLMYEDIVVRLERIIKRLWILIIIIFTAFVLSNSLWIYYESQWQVVEEKQEISQEGSADGGGNVILNHSQRDREILISRHVDGLTYDELSVKFHLSDRRIKTIVYKAEPILFKPQ